jgi:predicted DNA-binding transcriptional regulator YafY
MAKDTEKLIRQLSLISYLMAERRPVTALEIRRDVEGYSGMNEDAFARRFYADRAELDSLGIQLTVEKPADGAEQENYSLRPENFHLPAIAFTDEELASLQFALTLLDGEFAYAEPLRLALQQISWGRPSPLNAPDQGSIALGVTASAGGHDLSQRLAKIETAIFRNKTITFDYYTMERDEVGARRVDPYHLLFQGGQFYLLGRAHERGAIRVFRLSRIRGKVAYATKAEHDFKRPTDFDPRAYAGRADWQFGEVIGQAEVWISERIAWQVTRHFGRFGSVRPVEDDSGDVIFSTDYASVRQVAAWALRLGEHARVLRPEALVSELAERVERLHERHTGELALAAGVPSTAVDDDALVVTGPKREAAIRPERFARLVTLASILIQAGRANQRLQFTEVCEALQLSDTELREDVNVLNVVNFGGGSYVLYAEVHDDGTIEVDPEPYSDNFARPARLLPVEAKALIAAIDLIGDHLPEGALNSAREKIVAALGADPMEQGLQVASTSGDDSEIARVVSRAISESHLLRLEYYKANEDEFSERIIEPYALINGREGWYVASYDPARQAVRHFRLDRIKTAEVLAGSFTPRPEVDPAADVVGWPRTGEVEASRVARVWISPERARWSREQRRVAQELADGSVIVELPYKGTDWLVREVLAEAGDAAVLSPAEAREAVRTAVDRLQVAVR